MFAKYCTEGGAPVVVQNDIRTAGRESLGDPLPLALQLALILVLVVLNGFFVAAEFAMVKVRGNRIDTLDSEGQSTKTIDAYLSACQFGITLVSIGLGFIGQSIISNMLEPWFLELGLNNGFVIHAVSFLLAFSLLAIMHMVLGQWVPRTIALRKAETITLLTAKPLNLLATIMHPFIWVLNGLTNWLLNRFGIDPVTEQDSAHTEQEIRILMQESHKSGLIDNTELTLVDNIFDFAETNAREIMIPRTEMTCLYVNLSLEENKTIALEQMLTRYPVCENDKDNIIGFIHIKDLLKDTTHSLTDIRQITRPITTVPESMQISSLLKLMQKKKTQIAILIDEYGGTSGLVTLEDIMEEIVGEIQDEFDEERAALEQKDEQTYSISGLMLIEEVNSYFGLDIDTDDFDTIGGWFYSRIEIPPQNNHRIDYKDEIAFIIEETDHLRISRIMVRKLTQEPLHNVEPADTAIEGYG